MRVYIELPNTFGTGLTTEYLFDRWRMAEVRRRFWSHRNPAGNLVAQRKLHNCELLMQALYDEITRRAESVLPLSALLLLINTGNSFSINPKAKP